ncbi:glutathione peroxidase [Lederbergia wuyishanensis]|uniref:Glutathione peroxidase n=1 Tax=Lederbergia wuyishanensis TaxID=1347903 RepID=A0ABU0D6A9_9BACI|nr:glutathione peroxidase [Lederbergia wuyishanensis]MCJ8008652.1 glutathione peroxidase [Lederbergia wuyishanensis]MDQ0343930.1 glutathione peroxidase [Lederbergia wuyishanensis]
MSVYQFSATLMNGEEKLLSIYEGKLLLIVNTATKCGFAPQLKELQDLYDNYKEKGFEVLGFPCNQFMNQEPGSDEEVIEACQVNYGVQFPLFKKVHVRGKDAHPLYKYLTSESKGFVTSDIKWNFTKFLVDRNGEVIKRYAPTISPSKIEEDIIKMI